MFIKKLNSPALILGALLIGFVPTCGAAQCYFNIYGSNETIVCCDAGNNRLLWMPISCESYTPATGCTAGTPVDDGGDGYSKCSF